MRLGAALEHSQMVDMKLHYEQLIEKHNTAGLLLKQQLTNHGRATSAPAIIELHPNSVNTSITNKVVGKKRKVIIGLDEIEEAMASKVNKSPPDSANSSISIDLQQPNSNNKLIQQLQLENEDLRKRVNELENMIKAIYEKQNSTINNNKNHNAIDVEINPLNRNPQSLVNATINMNNMVEPTSNHNGNSTIVTSELNKAIDFGTNPAKIDLQNSNASNNMRQTAYFNNIGNNIGPNPPVLIPELNYAAVAVDIPRSIAAILQRLEEKIEKIAQVKNQQNTIYIF
jgi:hypothetical protein